MFGVFVGIASMADAGENVSETRRVDPAGTVRIHSIRGEIRIVGWDRPAARVEGEIDDLAERLQFVVNGDKTLIRVKMRDKKINWGDGSDLVIHLPFNSGVRMQTISADIDIRDITGDIIIRTVSGDVRAQHVGSATRIKTTSGDIEVSDGSGLVRAVTVSGDVSLDLEASDVVIDTMSGEVNIELADFDSLTARSVNGELAIEGTLNPAGRIEAATVNGEIALRLYDPVNARIEAHAGPGGDIENTLTDDKPQKGTSRRTQLQTVVGDGSATIRLVTVNGEIQLESG